MNNALKLPPVSTFTAPTRLDLSLTQNHQLAAVLWSGIPVCFSTHGDCDAMPSMRYFRAIQCLACSSGGQRARICRM